MNSTRIISRILISRPVRAISRNSSVRAKREMPPPITLQPRAIQRVKDMIEGSDDKIGVKVGVKRRGCNGYSYTMNYATKEDVDSKRFDVVIADGVYVLVDPKAVFFLAGTTMDYEETEMSAEFTFNNPNSKGSCGCGESFNV